MPNTGRNEMLYRNFLEFATSYILITETMALLLFLLIIVSIWVANKTGVWGLLLMAGGAIPVAIYYTYTSFHLWSSSLESHFYGRAAYAVFIITLIASMRRLYRRWKHGRNSLNT